MKKDLAVLVKVLVWLGFFINSGVPSSIWNSFHEKESSIFILHGVEIKRQHHSREEEGRFNARMFFWEQSKVKKAQEYIDNGGRYTADNYFADLREFVDSVKSFGQEPIGMVMSRLVGIDIRSRSQEQVDIARSKHFPEMTAQEMQLAKNTPAFSETCKEAGVYVWAWWFGWYLKSLGLALVLFLIWQYEESDYEKIQLRNPVSFMVALLLYPFVIIRRIRRRWHAEYEVRRRKEKLFSLLSRDEIALVKNFAKSNLSLKQFRQDLSLKGYVPKYSFIVVLFAMIFMAFVPSRILANQSREDRRIAIYQVTNDYDYFHSTGYVAAVDTYSPAYVFTQNDEWCKPLIVWIKVTLWRFIVSAPCRGHYRGLDPVPLVIKSNSVRKTFNNQNIFI